MNYQGFTNDSLTMMYEAVRGALLADDALTRQGMDTRFGARETPDWKKHAADLEAEMLKRGMLFEVIDWHNGQGTLLFQDAYNRLGVVWFDRSKLLEMSSDRR